MKDDRIKAFALPINGKKMRWKDLFILVLKLDLMDKDIAFFTPHCGYDTEVYLLENGEFMLNIDEIAISEAVWKIVYELEKRLQQYEPDFLWDDKDTDEYTDEKIKEYREIAREKYQKWVPNID